MARLILDGAFGTMLQAEGLNGDNELFNLSQRNVIASIHQKYIDAGADIIETNTFGANAIVQAEYGHAADAYELARCGAAIAREVADANFNGACRILVAGSVGPTSKSLSMGTDADNPAWRPVCFDEMAAAYKEQIRGLMDGGSDLILVETCFDALNAKAAIYAYLSLKEENSKYDAVRIAVSASPADRAGRVLTGQDIKAFYTAIRHCRPMFFALNCSLGAKEMIPIAEDVSKFVHADCCLFGCYPNAGLPNEMGKYDQSPENMAEAVREMLDKCDVDIIGGCCGTTPEHIKAIAAVSKELAKVSDTSTVKPLTPALTVSGLNNVTIDLHGGNFTNVGERTNVSGSRKFARLISESNYEEALGIAARQIADGADIIDINMDDAMLDGEQCMQDFVRRIQTESEVAKAALMIDSSSWPTILAGLKNAQGKCIVNSISLKEGEEAFLDKAGEIRKLGAAVVVMAFDEKGQATTFDRKIEICSRAYKLLTNTGFEPSDIIFDVNVLAVATGDVADRRHAVDFIEAVRWIKANLPGALTSGGISNLSFSFRGNNPVREAMHSVFLYHAINAGLDMGIVNPSMLQIYDEIEPGLRKAVEDVILDRRDDATDRLIEMAGKFTTDVSSTPGTGHAGVPGKHLSATELIVKGLSEGLEEAVDSELKVCRFDASAVIEGPLMAGMEKVGQLFADGKMFLPQVVKSARIMKSAVDLVTPYIKGEATASGRPLVVIATVKGDVHDIGKNITATVLRCNGFEVLDLGVMVDKKDILDAAKSHNATLVAVSGLITPSLVQMEDLCREMTLQGMTQPLIVGGATTNALHTAVKLSPLYDKVFHCCDASATAVLAKRLIAEPEKTIAAEHSEQLKLRTIYEQKRNGRTTALGSSGASSEASGASSGSGLFSYLSPDGFAPMSLMTGQDIPVCTVELKEVVPFFDWSTFFAIWGIKAVDYEKPEVLDIKRDAQKRLDGLDCTVRAALHFGDKWGFFAASVVCGNEEGSCHEGCPCCHKDDMMERTLCLTLADAAASWIESRIKVPAGYRMVRPAPGYPSCPDHSLKRDILAAIPYSDKLGISLTESFAMLPQASVCGYVIIHKNASYENQ